MNQFVNSGSKSATRDLSKVHTKNTFSPRMEKDTTLYKKKEALRSIIFLELKITGDIKGQIYADVSTQRAQDYRLDATSQTVFQDSVMIMEAIKAKKKRYL